MNDLNDHKYESLFLYETFIGVWVFYALISQFPTDWVIIIQTIIFSYIVAYLLLKESQRQIIHPFTSIVVLCIFRVDQIILKTDFTQVLTEITAHFLFLMLKYGDSILLIFLFISFCIFQCLRPKKRESIPKWFIFVTFLVIISLSIIFSFSPDEVLMLDTTTIQIEQLTRISIIDSCSGIYGLIIFSSSYFFFVNVTKTNRKFIWEQVVSFGIVGIIGVYLLNLFRILILIILSLYFPANIWSEVHIYLGGVFIIGYLAIFWGIIWSKLVVRSSI